MSKKNVIIYLEGKSEEIFIIDWRKNHGTFFCKEYKMKVIHMSRIDKYCIASVDSSDLIVIVADSDDENTNRKIKDAIVTCEVAKVDKKTVIQNPLFETFCASFFSNFIILPSWDLSKIKKESLLFLNKKNIELNKKWTYTEIKKLGGSFQNALRYKDRFGIINFLKKRR